MRKTFVFVKSFVLFFSVGAYASNSEKGLCSAGEIMIASCHLNENKKRVLSFCASADASWVAYRFGTKSKIELEKQFFEKYKLFRWVDKATYTTYFGFRLSGYAYVFGVPQQRFGAKAFLEVSYKESNVMGLDCAENSFGQTDLRSSAIYEVPDDVVRKNRFIFPPY